MKPENRLAHQRSGTAFQFIHSRRIRESVSIDDLRLERWARDRDYFTAAAEQLGAKVYIDRRTPTSSAADRRSKT